MAHPLKPDARRRLVGRPADEDLGPSQGRHVIRVKRITPDDPLYKQECALREEALLAPVGLDMARFLEHVPGVEHKASHILALAETPTGERVVGCVLVQPDARGPGRARLLQMAVHPQRQREGIGKRLLAEAESIAFGKLAQTQLFCHAQLDAVPFYERCGWKADGERIIEAGIPHQRLWLGEAEPHQKGPDEPTASDPESPRSGRRQPNRQ